MATIQIHNLTPAGSELFSDSESYLSELSDNELAEAYGGKTWMAKTFISSPKCAVASAVITLISVATYGAYQGWNAA
ncbi:MAG: hypothetical protein RID53_14470 [Coleofasciculus sp. B1-GNL1-01]|uniref:hypothetical protein n=1 Tax=Coleofasciculus sp. B1-GNL1-01 TaxID=3068484 RepID=UPI0032FADD72